MFFLHGFNYAADKGSGGGTPADAESTDEETTDGSGADDGEENGNEVSFDEKQQAAINKIIKDRLERAQVKWKAEADKAAEKARRAADEQRLQEQEQWQELATTRQQTIADLETRVSELEEPAKLAKRYEKVLAGYRDKLIEGVPEHVAELLNGRDVADQLDYLTKYREEIVGEQKQAPSWGPPPSPKNGSDQAGRSTKDRASEAYKPRF